MRMAKRTKRARKKGRPAKGTPDWKPAFLAAYTRTGNIGASCELSQVARSTLFEARKNDAAFRTACEAARATATDALEHEARRRALEGWDEPVFHQGRPCGFWIDEKGRVYGDKEKKPAKAKFVPVGVRKFSDTLLIFLLKGNRPKKFRENIRHEHGGVKDGPPIGILTVEAVKPHDDNPPPAVAPVDRPGDAGQAAP